MNNAFPERLKSQRMQKGLSQRQFAALVELNYSQYNRYEIGDRKPSTDTIAKIAEALQVSVDYLLDGKEEDAAIANLEDRDLIKIFEEVEQLPDETKNAVKIILQSVVKQNRHAQIA